MIMLTLRLIAIALVILVTVATAVYMRDIGRAYARIASKSSVIASPHGNIEFTEGGTGPAVLVIHGSGGGYDQGELIADSVIGDNFHWIAPSRFGYLRSSFHVGATFDDQARAYAHLLDYLDIRKVAVVALSHGGPSALLFAALYPERVSSLTLISCGVSSFSDSIQDQANEKGDMLTTIYQYDPLYWGISRILKKQLMNLMGADDEVITGLTPDQRQLINQIIDYMNPVSPRSTGVAFDNKAALPNGRIAGINAPTLIFHATDDTLQLYRNAEFAAATIPGAQLNRFDRGGHLLIAIEQATIRELVQNFILVNSAR
jgi:2-hydroxy-6-oxonona-2,4-dienedioate hydrolase